MNTFEIIGWVGAILYIVAYFLLSIGKMKAETIQYHLLNVMGALGLIINAFYLKDLPNIIVNLVWFGIGLYAINNVIRKFKRSKKK